MAREVLIHPRREASQGLRTLTCLSIPKASLSHSQHSLPSLHLQWPPASQSMV